MDALGCKAWTIRQSQNLWGQPVGPEGAQPDIGLFLIYGPCFGLVRSENDAVIRTMFGPVLDDVERTARVYRRDQQIARYQRYAVVKLKRPGAFVEGSGGVSALYQDCSEHAVAKLWQMHRLQQEFPDIVKLKDGDVADMDAPFRFIRRSAAAARMDHPKD